MPPVHDEIEQKQEDGFVLAWDSTDVSKETRASFARVVADQVRHLADALRSDRGRAER